MKKGKSVKSEALVLIEMDNTAPYVEIFKSSKFITMQRIVEHMESTIPDIKWSEDSVTILEPPEVTNLD